MSEHQVRPGQVWADNDYREAGRTVRIDSVDDRYAYCTVLTGRASQGSSARTGHKTRIALARMRPTSTGYRLESETPDE